MVNSIVRRYAALQQTVPELLRCSLCRIVASLKARGTWTVNFAYKRSDHPLDGITIERGLGRGAFGEVYLGVCNTGARVALKRLLAHSAIEARGTSKCLGLTHPNLVELKSLARDTNGCLWVIMEYVPGEPLSEHIARHRRGLPLIEVQRWIEQILLGVEYLHAHSIIHRDLKPSNMFVNVLKIGDYGLARVIENRDQGTPYVGTLPYMAPEVFGRPYDVNVDWYSVGIILCELLTGRIPYLRHSTGGGRRLYLDLIPDSCRPTVARLLQDNAAERCPSVAAFLSEFRSSLSACQSQLEVPLSLNVASWSCCLTTRLFLKEERTRNSSLYQALKHLPRSEVLAALVLGVLSASGGDCVGGLYCRVCHAASQPTSSAKWRRTRKERR